jgi:hypothetical protein
MYAAVHGSQMPEETNGLQEPIPYLPWMALKMLEIF